VDWEVRVETCLHTPPRDNLEAIKILGNNESSWHPVQISPDRMRLARSVPPELEKESLHLLTYG